MKKNRQLLIFFIFLSTKIFAQDSLQIVLDKLKSQCSKSTTLVLITKSGEEKFSAINNFSPSIKYDKNTPFFIGSVSKIFTSVVILKLIEQNKLQLSTPLSSFAFSKRLNKNISQKITVNNLLQHTSGIADFGDTVLDKSNPEASLGETSFIDPSLSFSTEFILTKLISKSEFKPGIKCKYSNTNYFLLAQIIQELTDMPYSEAIRNAIIVPLELKNTLPYLSNNIEGLMNGFDDYGNEINKFNFIQYNNICEGSGNITSTLTDLTSFFKALFIDKKLLKDSTLKLMLQFIPMNEYGDEMGLGILRTRQLEIPFVGHQGDILLNQIDVFYNERSQGIYALVTNESNIKVKNKILVAIFKEFKRQISKAD